MLRVRIIFVSIFQPTCSILILILFFSSFLIVDTCNGVQIYTYDGRLVSSPKYPGLRPELLTPNAIGLSSDVLAIKDHTDEKSKRSLHRTYLKS